MAGVGAVAAVMEGATMVATEVEVEEQSDMEAAMAMAMVEVTMVAGMHTTQVGMGMVLAMAGVLATIVGSLVILHVIAMRESLYEEGGEVVTAVVVGAVIDPATVVVNWVILLETALLPIDSDIYIHTDTQVHCKGYSL